MKFLICLVLTLNVFASMSGKKAAEFVSNADISEKKSAMKPEHATIYEGEFNKALELKLKAMAHNDIEELFRKGLKEGNCIEKMRSKLDSFSLPYNGSESCAQLIAACNNNEKCKENM